ncbi:hypothetical protein NPX13_g10162 [Xylaria arbuscula]|uniref:Uncharacterized protein n=1 Tax=Xylaria arbuscula TaxID=114810 RepID=A0A9W8N5C5_9PEZI|nr:hypothetical protein NPX13_g10162 [Xylaria arbuscula]
MSHGKSDRGNPFKNTKFRAYIEGGPFYYQRESPAILMSTAEAMTFLESQPYNAQWTIAQIPQDAFPQVQSVGDTNANADRQSETRHRFPETLDERNERDYVEKQEQEMQRVLDNMATFSRRRVELLQELAECAKGEEQMYREAANNPKLHKMFVAFMALHVNDDRANCPTHDRSDTPVPKTTSRQQRNYVPSSSSKEIKNENSDYRLAPEWWTKRSQKRSQSNDGGPFEHKYRRR